MKLWLYLKSLDTHQKTYWLGLLMSFTGLSFTCSVAVALVVVGGLIAVESVLTSYLAAWINRNH